MKGMRVFKKNKGGYLTQLESSRPELFKTVKSYRDRLTTPEQKTFDQRANIQLAASRNMPQNQRQAYYASIEKEFGQPNEKQFQQVREGLKSKTFTPTYSFYTPPEQNQQQGKTAATTGYYRDLSKEMADMEKQMKGLTVTEQKTGTRTPYTLQRSNTNAGLAGYTPPPPSKPVYKLPQGYTQEFRTNSGPFNTGGGQTAYGSTAPGQNTGPYGTYQPRDYYVKGRPETYTYDVTRAQKAGDAEYDKLARQLETYRTRHKYRNLYSGQPTSSSSSSAGIYQKLGMNQAQQVTPFANLFPSTTMKVKEGGEIKGKGKAVRGFKFGGIK